MPVDVEVCHGVAAAAGGSLKVAAVPAEHVLLARQLVGVATIQRRVANYALEEQALSAQTMRRLMQATKGRGGDVGGGGTGGGAAYAAVAARITQVVVEAVAGAPVGRVPDMCDDAAELLGVANAADGVVALCRAYGCCTGAHDER